MLIPWLLDEATPISAFALALLCGDLRVGQPNDLLVNNRRGSGRTSLCVHTELVTGRPRGSSRFIGK